MDDLTFRVQFAGNGAERLRDRVKEKLKEFMGDYTDDTLVVDDRGMDSKFVVERRVIIG